MEYHFGNITFLEIFFSVIVKAEGKYGSKTFHLVFTRTSLILFMAIHIYIYIYGHPLKA